MNHKWRNTFALLSVNILYSALFLLLSCSQTREINITPPDLSLCIIPQPRHIEQKDIPPTRFYKDWAILLESTSNEFDRYSAQILQTELKNVYGIEILILIDDTLIKDRNKIILMGIPDRDKQLAKRTTVKGLFIQQWLGKEGYMLDISPDEIFILGNDYAGIYYGVQTLRQLIHKEYNEIVAPSLTIRDTPKYKWRGYQLDISRNPLPKMDYFKQIIKTLGLYKINMLTLYTEPQVFKSQKYPNLGNPESALSPEQITELVHFAQFHNVELVGNFQSFGHWDKVLSATDKDVIENENNPTSLSPVKEKTYEVLSNLYAEIAPAYLSEFFNINCDEPIDLGKGTSALSVSPGHEAELWLAHINRLYKIFMPYQKHLMAWSDVPLKYERIIPDLPKDLTIMNYSNQLQDNYFELINIFKKEKLRQFICPGISNTNQMFPHLYDAMENISRFIKKGNEMSIDGMILCGSWQGKGEDWPEVEWYPLLWAVECAWLPDQIDEKYFRQKFTRSFYGNGTEEAVKIAEYLSKPAELLGSPADITKICWENPFTSTLHLTIPDFILRVNQAEESVTNAVKLIEQLKQTSLRHKDNLDYLLFTTNRWQNLITKIQLAYGIKIKYNQTYSEWSDVHQIVVSKLEEINSDITKLNEQLKALENQYTTLYDRIYQPNLREEVLARFHALEMVYQTKKEMLTQLHNDFVVTGKLAPPEALELQEIKVPTRVVKPNVMPPTAEFAKIPTWWNRDWHHRMLIQLKNPSDKRVDYPAEISINFSELLKGKGIEEEWDKNSIRVIEFKGHDKPTQPDNQPDGDEEVPYQFDAVNNFNTKYNASGNLAWMIKGNWAQQTIRSYYIYFDTLLPDGQTSNNKPKKAKEYRVAGLKTYDGKKGNKWIENDQMKVELNPKGCRLTQWWLKGSNRQIISDTEGFMVISSDKDKTFNLTLELSGPIMTRYRADQPDSRAGITGVTSRIINFFHNLPLVEIILSYDTPEYNNYDTFLDKNTRVKYLFSNYFTGIITSKKEKEVLEEATNWTAKITSDGLTIGCLTPDEKVSHYVRGNAFGMNDRKNRTSHFLIFADKLEPDSAKHQTDLYHFLHQLRLNYTLLEPPQVQRGIVETGP